MTSVLDAPTRGLLRLARTFRAPHTRGAPGERVGRRHTHVWLTSAI